ncbi:MAG: DoxX family membrane protein [Streptosporangiales bacterium]|nr:DoxX family membrane protein [Streptosporangiales bacterium]
MGADLGILVARLVIGLLFIGHGLGKLFGLFGQGGIQGTGAFMQSVGYTPGETMAIVAGVVELVAGVLLVVGFLVPLAAAMIIGDMINASAVKSADGFWIATGGFEYEFVLIVLAVAFAMAGAGAFSVDKEREWFRSRTGGVAVAIVLGVVSGVVLLMMRGTPAG